MPSFTTRVELHKANESDYENLHAAMKDEGFLRTIKSDDGKIYQLPTAEYNMPNVKFSRKEVLDKAESAASTTGKAYGIIVTESNGRKWTGLEKVNSEF